MAFYSGDNRSTYSTGVTSIIVPSNHLANLAFRQYLVAYSLGKHKRTHLLSADSKHLWYSMKLAWLQ